MSRPLLRGRLKANAVVCKRLSQLPVHQEGHLTEPTFAMNKIPSFVFLTTLAALVAVQSQDASNSIIAGQPAVPTTVPAATARIIGSIPDGTPPPPAPPKPKFVVPPGDILATTTHEQGGRTITIQKSKPLALPEPPAPRPAASTANVDNTAFKQRLAEYRANHPLTPVLSLGATIYRLKDSPPRTLVRYWPMNGGEPFSFWSSADFALISGIHSFAATNGRTYGMFLVWGNIDTTRMAALAASHGREYHPPDIPVLPEGPATFTVVGTPPSADLLVAIQSLHDIYNSEYDRLKTACEGRERARLQHEADLKNNPPQPKDITVRYWNIPAEQAARLKGEAQP